MKRVKDVSRGALEGMSGVVQHAVRGVRLTDSCIPVQKAFELFQKKTKMQVFQEAIVSDNFLGPTAVRDAIR